MSFHTPVSLSARRESQLVRLLQAAIIGILAVGLWQGNAGIAVNASVGLLVTFLPAFFDRNYSITMNGGIVLWITLAMFLHALGTLSLPALGFISPYKSTWWWDHMTHALSSSLVAGVAYAVTRALEEHTEYISMPPTFMFVYLLLFVMAFGVIWELIEFYVAVVSNLVGIGKVLTQYGLDDTILDLFYNTIGGLLVAVFGTAHLTDLSDQLRAKFESPNR
ncbi:hypothetical protein ZOD2009_14006 [Haladaptatus paucihalophilus DX253]|uniref:Membrane-spanning protein n=1 Tax=Haladaptatus paucihalophilus DX253 TaxID=797209 RepID=E7QVG5_HALPU|nr:MULTISPECIES: hypothetical protein [Haladaptatus]EFW91487.1 hypothetical protein ZOD2009_14006 [Haladaptatus paucihalophilus DX253]GKZ15441.1 hypothetical protein HAL_33220 [Haladaptatus sp. T7]SHL31196.1 hypothetical protein SAMN05444342_3485 [Haladaptatus paucihalophilus DX253]